MTFDQQRAIAYAVFLVQIRIDPKEMELKRNENELERRRKNGELTLLLELQNKHLKRDLSLLTPQRDNLLSLLPEEGKLNYFKYYDLGKIAFGGK